jgi:hypothetical protein
MARPFARGRPARLAVPGGHEHRPATREARARPLIRAGEAPRLWAAAVAEAGSLTQADVIAALDHAQIADGPGGPATMVPGQHHVRMSMYIAQARDGRFEIAEDLGAIDPQERLVDTPVLAG